MKDAFDTMPRKGARAARIAIWSAVIGILLVLVSGLAPRMGVLAPLTGLGAYALGSLFLVVALIAAVLGLIRGSGGSAPRRMLWIALLGGLAITVGNGVFIARTGNAPPINDISTDLANPPEFVAVIPLRAGASNPAAYAGPQAAAMQRSAYPDIGPLYVDAPADEVFATVRQVIEGKGWDLVGADQATGRIEAVATTRWTRSRSDVVVRVTAGDGQTRIDVRSKSRAGRGDLGVNARRIRELLAATRASLQEERL